MLDTNVLWSSTVGRTFLTLITLGSGRNGWSNKPEESSQSQSAYIHIEIMQFTNLSIICVSCGLTCLSIFLPQSGKLARCGLLLLLSSAYVKLYQFLCVHDHVSTMLSPCGSRLRARNEFFSHHLQLDLCTLSVLTVKPLKHGECSLCLHGRK